MAEHHPAPELLTAFSAGSLPLSQALCVSAHIEYCEVCRTNLRRLNGMGAALFEELAPEKVSEQLKNNVLSMLDASSPQQAPVPAPRCSSGIPRALQQFIPDNYDALAWQTASPSIRTATLCTDSNGARVEMIRIKPGGRVASHTHCGDEYTLVLEGSFSDESGIYCAGDFLLRDQQCEHKPVATKDRECICLTVTDAPIRFTGFFGQLLNPFIRKRYLPV